MNEPTTEELIELVMTQFRQNEPFTADEIADAKKNSDVQQKTVQLESNFIHFEFVFDARGETYHLTNTDLVYEEGHGWVCFFDGSGPNDAYCMPGPDGKYVIEWM